MPKTTEKLLLIILDFITINSSFLLWCKVREMMHVFTETSLIGSLKLSLIIYLFWLILFLFFGLYGVFFTKSRVDEFIDVLKIVSIGVFVIFVIVNQIFRFIQHDKTSFLTSKAM